MQGNISVDTTSGNSLRYQTRFCNPIARRENHMITIKAVSRKLSISPFSVSRTVNNRLCVRGNPRGQNREKVCTSTKGGDRETSYCHRRSSHIGLYVEPGSYSGSCSVLSQPLHPDDYSYSRGRRGRWVNGRILADEMGKLLGQQMIVTNKPGASDTLGTDALAKSKRTAIRSGIPIRQHWSIPVFLFPAPCLMTRRRISIIWVFMPSTP